MENDYQATESVVQLPQEDSRLSPALQRAIKREGLGYMVDALSDAQVRALEDAIVMDNIIHDDEHAHHFFDRLARDYAEELQHKTGDIPPHRKQFEVTPHSWAERIEAERDEHSHIHDVGHTAT